MPRNSKSFQPGKSGNPKGRPPKKRALTELLEKAGKKKFKAGDKDIAAKQLFAERVWEGLATGYLTYIDPAKGERIQFPLDAQQYVNLAKLVLGQIDGPPRAEVDLTSDGKAIASTPTIDSMQSLFQDMSKREKDADADH